MCYREWTTYLFITKDFCEEVVGGSCTQCWDSYNEELDYLTLYIKYEDRFCEVQSSNGTQLFIILRIVWSEDLLQAVQHTRTGAILKKLKLSMCVWYCLQP